MVCGKIASISPGTKHRIRSLEAQVKVMTSRALEIVDLKRVRIVPSPCELELQTKSLAHTECIN